MSKTKRLLLDFIETREQRKNIEAREKSLRTEILDLFGNEPRDLIKIGSWKIRIEEKTLKTLDAQALRDFLGENIVNFERVTTYLQITTLKTLTEEQEMQVERWMREPKDKSNRKPKE